MGCELELWGMRLLVCEIFVGVVWDSCCGVVGVCGRCGVVVVWSSCCWWLVCVVVVVWGNCCWWLVCVVVVG